MAILGKYRAKPKKSVEMISSADYNNDDNDTTTPAPANLAASTTKNSNSNNDRPSSVHSNNFTNYSSVPTKRRPASAYYSHEAPSSSTTTTPVKTNGNIRVSTSSVSTIPTGESSPDTEHSVIVIDEDSGEEAQANDSMSHVRPQHSGSSRSTTKSGVPASVAMVMDEDSSSNKRASVYSMTSISEADRAQLLREEINRETASLAKLEQLVQDLPRLAQSNNHSHMHNYQYGNGTEHGGFTAGTYTDDDLQSTSKVIERLQMGNDALRRELKEQSEIAKDERLNKEAYRKRSELFGKKIESLEHQNEMFSQILDRKERKITELEHKVKQCEDQIKTLQVYEQSSSSIQEMCDQKVAAANAEKDRAEAAYQAVLDSCGRIKAKYHDDIVVISGKISAIQKERQDDSDRLRQLSGKLEDQAKEKQKLLHIQQQTSEMRKRHIKALEGMFEDMKTVISDSDKSMNNRVKSTLRVINKLEQQYIELGGDKSKLDHSIKAQ